MPVKWDPSNKDAPQAVGASSTPCCPTADSKSKPENPGGPWSNAKGKGLDRKAQAGITSCIVLVLYVLVVLEIWASGVRVLFCYKGRICGGIAHSTPLPRFLGSHNGGGGRGAY